MRWSLSLISSWALDAEVRVRQGCYRSTPSGEEAKGAEEERREVTGRVFSRPLVLKRRTQRSHLPWGAGGKEGHLSPRPSSEQWQTFPWPLPPTTHCTLSLATALKPVSSASLLPGLPASSRSSPVHLAHGPRQVFLHPELMLPLSGSQPAHGSVVPRDGVRPLSLAVQAPLIRPLHPLQHHSRYVCPRTLHSNRQTLLLQVGP